MFAAVLLCFVTDRFLEFTEAPVVEGLRGCFVGGVDFALVNSEFFEVDLRRPFLVSPLVL